jgi:hypothetical protein
MSAETAVCARCEGTGKIRYDHDELDAQGEVIGHTSGTRACICVRDLPPIDGDASWWDLEVVWQKVWAEGIYPDAVAEITVSAEVPRGEDGRRRHLRGNRYYPTMIEIEWPDRMLLHPFMARELALRLMSAAAAAEAIDEPCEDVCGHWAPCDCSLASPRKLVGSDREENR